MGAFLEKFDGTCCCGGYEWFAIELEHYLMHLPKDQGWIHVSETTVIAEEFLQNPKREII